MKVYVDPRKMKELAAARQGLAGAIQDIEGFSPPMSSRTGETAAEKNSQRVKMEGDAVCQSDSEKNQWGSHGRFVYGTDSKRERALYIGHVDEHNSSHKVKDAYGALKAKAERVTDADFEGKTEITSREIIQCQREAIADIGAGKPQKAKSRLEILEELYHDAQDASEGERAAKLQAFSEVVDDDFKENGRLSQPDRKRLVSRPLVDTFRRVVEEKNRQAEREAEARKGQSFSGILKQHSEPVVGSGETGQKTDTDVRAQRAAAPNTPGVPGNGGR